MTSSSRWTSLLLFCLLSMIGLSQQPPRRSLEQLINTAEPGWALVAEWMAQAKNTVEVLPRDPVRADSALIEAQITTRSPMGAIIHGSGGILVDHGWVRILGSGCTRLDRSVMAWNKGKTYDRLGEPASFLLIADDALGGFFAINAGGLDTVEMGKVFYLAPETLQWTSTGLGYSEFVAFCFQGDLALFYSGLRWDGWQQEVEQLHGDQGFHCFPPLFTREGKDVNKVHRKAVPIEELWSLHSGM